MVCPIPVTGEEFTRYISATKSTEGTMCLSAVTGEELTRYISSLLETPNPVPTLGSTMPILLMNTHTDPAFIVPALLIKRRITPNDYAKVKKKKKMNLVTFKKGLRFWTIDEAKESADKEDNHDIFSVCTNFACSDACPDVMPSFLDVTQTVHPFPCHYQTLQIIEWINVNLIYIPISFQQPSLETNITVQF